MALKLRNRWHYTGAIWDSHYWDWEVFLDDGGSGELSNVQSVTYILHPTFEIPIHEETNPQGGFLLKSRGERPFVLTAFVYTKDGEKKKLTHLLKLEINPTDGTSK